MRGRLEDDGKGHEDWALACVYKGSDIRIVQQEGLHNKRSGLFLVYVPRTTTCVSYFVIASSFRLVYDVEFSPIGTQSGSSSMIRVLLSSSWMRKTTDIKEY